MNSNTILAYSQLVLSLATLFGALFAGLNSLKNGKKVDAVAVETNAHTGQLAELKVATNGLTEHLANASKQAGTAIGINQGIAEERIRAEATAKDLLNREGAHHG